jgi:hypothetical protein
MRSGDVLAEEGMTKMEAMGGACSQFFRNAFLRLVHAECLKACNRHEDAMVAIKNAKAWLLSVVAKIGEDEYKKSFLENVPENRRILELAEEWTEPAQSSSPLSPRSSSHR